MRSNSEFLEKFGYLLEWGKRDIKHRILTVIVYSNVTKKPAEENFGDFGASNRENHCGTNRFNDYVIVIHTDRTQTEAQEKGLETPKTPTADLETQTEEPRPSEAPAPNSIPKGGKSRKRAAK